MSTLDGNTLEEKVAMLHRYLLDAEDDLGELADIVNNIAARGAYQAQAERANAIAHKWLHRRSKRKGS